MNNQIEGRALRITQTGKIPLYSFYLKGEEILEVAEISRIKRDECGGLLGYQRGEVSRHIGEITNYLDSGDVIFPNAILLAMSTEVRFKQSRGPKVGTHDTQAGVLSIPIGNAGSKVAWIVDGQQRTVALSKAKRKNLLVPVTAFVSDDFEVHRGQFLLVNKVKPLPKGLINELLPTVNTTLPTSLAKNKIPSALCDLLNRDPESPNGRSRHQVDGGSDGPHHGQPSSRRPYGQEAGPRISQASKALVCLDCGKMGDS